MRSACGSSSCRAEKGDKHDYRCRRSSHRAVHARSGRESSFRSCPISSQEQDLCHPLAIEDPRGGQTVLGRSVRSGCHGSRDLLRQFLVSSGLDQRSLGAHQQRAITERRSKCMAQRCTQEAGGRCGERSGLLPDRSGDRAAVRSAFVRSCHEQFRHAPPDEFTQDTCLRRGVSGPEIGRCVLPTRPPAHARWPRGK